MVIQLNEGFESHLRWVTEKGLELLGHLRSFCHEVYKVQINCNLTQ